MTWKNSDGNKLTKGLSDPNREERVGAITVTIDVGDIRGQRFESVEVMVDTGSTFTAVPGSLLRRLGISVQRTVPVRLADGSQMTDEVADAVVLLEGQRIITPVIFAREGEPNLLGVVALETALLAVDPVSQRLIATEALKMTATASN